MHHSVPTESVVIMEDQKFLYLLFCSKVFRLVKSIKGDRYFEHSPIGARVFEYQFSELEHWSVIRCSPIAAEKLMLIRNHYNFPSSEHMIKELNNCRDYPDASIHWEESI
jgi:hypothetical protein